MRVVSLRQCHSLCLAETLCTRGLFPLLRAGQSWSPYLCCTAIRGWGLLDLFKSFVSPVTPVFLHLSRALHHLATTHCISDCIAKLLSHALAHQSLHPAQSASGVWGLSPGWGTDLRTQTQV